MNVLGIFQNPGIGNFTKYTYFHMFFRTIISGLIKINNEIGINVEDVLVLMFSASITMYAQCSLRECCYAK